MLRRQAEHFALLGSPVYELAGRSQMIRRPLGESSGTTRRGSRPPPSSAPCTITSLLGIAPNALSGDWVDFTAALAAHPTSLRRFVEEQGVQTNETQRCVALVPAFLTLARESGLPLDLIELGPSAGLNLVFDRYGYRYAEGAFGDPGARLIFDATERGRVPADLLGAPLEIREPRGIDLVAVDVATGDGLPLLHSFLWPGLTERAVRLDAAIGTFLESPSDPSYSRATTSTFCRACSRSDRRTPSRSCSRPRRPGISIRIATTPCSRRSTRPPRTAAHSPGSPRGGGRRRSTRTTSFGWELELRIWPAHARLVALVDYHGNWIDWVG